MGKRMKQLWIVAFLCLSLCVQNVRAEETPNADVISANMQKAMTDVKVIGLDVMMNGMKAATVISDQNTGISKVTTIEGTGETVTWVDQNAGKSYVYNSEISKYEFEPTEEKESEAQQTVDESMTTIQNLKFTYDGTVDQDGKSYYKLNGTYTDNDVKYDYILYVDPESYRLKSLTVVTAGVPPMAITAEFSYPESLVLPADVAENAILAKDYNVSGKDCKHVVYAVKHVGDEAVFYAESTTQNRGKVTIMDSVTVCGEKYPIYGISDEAFKGKTQITSIVIGKNVQEIGKQAFSGCKKLKNVTIKSTTLKKIGLKAFDKNAKNLKIKVPKKNLSKYKGLLKKAKLDKKVTVTK